MDELELCELLEALFDKEIREYKEEQGYTFDDELDISELAKILYNECDMNFDQLNLIVERLLPLCQIDKSKLTNKVYQGFGKNNMWIIKKEV